MKKREDKKNANLNIEIKKINKSTKEIEWTNTLEIPYEDEGKEQIPTNKNNDHLVNNKMNPFHEPDMNTIEFDNSDVQIIVNLTKENNLKATVEERAIALKTLLDHNVISKEEYDEKMKLITNEIKNSKD